MESMETGIHLVPRVMGERFSTTNPATGELLVEYAAATEREVAAAIARARQAQRWWGALPQICRSAVLRRFAALLLEEKDALARQVTRECGKPLQEALLTDVLVSAESALFYAEEAAHVLRTGQVPHANPALRLKRGELRWLPVGVVGVISPWNYPMAIPAADALAALATGNAVVLKPSELTPQCALEMERVFIRALHEEGIPVQPSPWQVVNGLGPAGQALVEGEIDKLVFTGSVSTGRRVAQAAAERLLPVVLELGGKDAMIVLDDADLDTATSAAVWGAMMNAGQTCISVERCYVQRRVYSRFVALAVEKIRKLRVGDGLDAEIDMGPLITPKQLRIVEEQVEEARALGATVHIGGHPLREIGGNFYAPTLITDADQTMRLMNEETFGPVLPVLPFSDDDEAVALANGGGFGLAASVWGTTTRATRVARRIQAGAVLVNDVITGFAVAAAPHGGMKQSGMGRSHGRLGMQEFVRPQFVDVDLAPRMKKLWWYPYAGNFAPMKAFIEMAHGKGLRRLRAALASLPLLGRKRT
ncbi:MAG: aldehyde dehydrogenase family protein [Acidobacteriota bacterium]|nr:aldehyde dehydrogenase family protein [Acidobacteriota bacterium]